MLECDFGLVPKSRTIQTWVMVNSTPFLPGLSHHLFGRQRRSQLDQLREQAEQWRASSLSQLCEIFGPWLPSALLAPTAKGLNSRQRTYPLNLTFWAFLSQVLSPAAPVGKWCEKSRFGMRRRARGPTAAPVPIARLAAGCPWSVYGNCTKRWRPNSLLVSLRPICGWDGGSR